MLKGTLGLRAPQSPLGHADRAKRIGLTAHLGHRMLPLAGTGGGPMKDEARLVPGLATSFTLIEVGTFPKKAQATV
jgi:hypothetical protein